jgi:hypothetical protein
MFHGKLRIAVIILAAAVVSTACGLAHTSGSGDGTKAAPQKPADRHVNTKQQVEKDEKGTNTYSGRVVDSAGKPMPGANLYIQSPWQAKPVLPPAKLQATTGEDGRFQFRAKPHSPNMLGLLVATADGYGPAWVPADPKEELTVTLAKDDVPISGRVVDLQGKPVIGATIRVLHVQTSNNSPKDDDLTPFLKAAKTQKDNTDPRRPEHQFYLMLLRGEEIPTLPQLTRTDTDGWFRLSGVGRERMVGVAIEGPTIATQEVRILTRAPLTPGGLGEVRGAAAELSGMSYYFATFTHAAAPTQPITGVVRAKDTHQPIAGVRMWSQSPRYSYVSRSLVSTTTDAQGRYRLVGAPKGGEIHVGASSDKEPFLTAIQRVPAGQGLEAVTLDFELKRGVWVQGHVVDKVTRKPVSHVRVGYVAFADNPHVKDVPLVLEPPLASGAESSEDGACRVLALPGPGMILARTGDPTNPYLSEPERDGGLREGFLNTRPTFEIPGNYNLMTRIDRKDGTELLKLDLPLDPGETRKGTVIDPAGEPLCKHPVEPDSARCR